MALRPLPSVILVVTFLFGYANGEFLQLLELPSWSVAWASYRSFSLAFLEGLQREAVPVSRLTICIHTFLRRLDGVAILLLWVLYWEIVYSHCWYIVILLDLIIWESN